MAAGKSALDQIKQQTIVVADTGNLDEIKKLKPTDVTTNPTLLLNIAESPEYSHLLDESIAYANKHARSSDEQIELAIEKLSVVSGREISKIITGRVSTEIDPRVAFDKDAQVQKALKIVKLYNDEGVPAERVLIKIPATWEGIKAAEILEKKHNVRCNITLLFNFCQAVAAAEANATLISPYVGRILDWYAKNTNVKSFNMLEDPGVVNTTKIYNYYKKHGYKTQVMAASFRNLDQIKGLNGCDLLTISPKLIDELSKDNSKVDVQLKHDKNKPVEPKPKQNLDEKTFRWQMNEDETGSELLSDGIRRFSIDIRKLEKILIEKLSDD